MPRYEIHGDGFNITVTASSHGGSLKSDLRDDLDSNFGKDDATARAFAEAEIDVVESLVLAHACAGIDVTDPKYVEGLNTTLNALAQ